MKKIINNIKQIGFATLLLLSSSSSLCHKFRIWNRTGENIEVTMANATAGKADYVEQISSAKPFTEIVTKADCLKYIQVKGLSGPIAYQKSLKVAGKFGGIENIACGDFDFVAERVGDQLVLRRMLDPNEPFNHYTKWVDLGKNDDGTYFWIYNISAEKDKWNAFQKYLDAAEYVNQLEQIEQKCREAGVCQ